MQSHTTIRSWRAMLLASLFIGGTCFVLFQDLIDGGKFGTDHVLTALALIGTTAAGHSFLPTWKEGRRLNAVGLAVLFLVGLGFVATKSGARNAETANAKSVEREDAKTQRQKAQTAFDTAVADATKLDAEARKQCASGPGPLCRGAQANADRGESHRRLKKAELDLHKPSIEANAGYAHFARILALAGADEKRATEALVLLMPFAAVLLAELGTIVFLSLALGHAAKPQRPAANTNEPPPGAVAGGQPKRHGNVIEHPVLEALRKANRPLSNDELASAMRVTKGEASKRRREVGHKLVERREGRHLMVSVR